MIDISKFIRLRKMNKISQTSLCQGICTQATLSKFENNGQVPSYKILKRLCSRLGIEVSDIMKISQDQLAIKKMSRAEFAFFNYDFSQILRLLADIQPNQLRHQKDKLQYTYLRGLYAWLGERDQMHALYFFNKILKNVNLDDTNIYRLLALDGFSQVALKRKEIDKAKNCYQEVADNIKRVTVTGQLMTLQVLTILFHAGEFYGKEASYRRSNSLLRYAYRLGMQHHVVYFMAQILYWLGRNDIAQGKMKERSRQRLNDACAFARFNHNQMTLTHAKKLLAKIAD